MQTVTVVFLRKSMGYNSIVANDSFNVYKFGKSQPNVKMPSKNVADRENMDLNDREKSLIEHLKDNYSSDKITCPAAQAMAQEWDVEMGRMGAILTELGIKINHCMLGCFK